MQTQIHFNKVVKTDDKVFLRDEIALSRLMTNVEALQDIINETVDLLTECDFPVNPDDVMRICNNGRDGLRSCAYRRADAEADRLKVRPYVRAEWRKSECDCIRDDVRTKASELQDRFAKASDGLISVRKYISQTEDGRIIVDAEGLTDFATSSTMCEITVQMQQDIDALQDTAKRVRELEMRGINALELIGKYVHSEGQPEEAVLYNDIMFRRHTPGQIHLSAIDALINKQAIANLN